MKDKIFVTVYTQIYKKQKESLLHSDESYKKERGLNKHLIETKERRYNMCDNLHNYTYTDIPFYTKLKIHRVILPLREVQIF